MRCQLKRLVFLRVCREGGYSFGDSQQAPLNYLWLAERRLALEVGSGQHAQPLRGAPRLLPGLISPQRAVRCGAVPSWHLGRCFRRLLLPWRARGRGFYCERSSSLLRFRGSEEAGPGPTAGTLQTPQKSLAHLGSSWLREGSRRLTDPLVPSPRPPLTAPPAEHPRAKRAPGSYRGAPWPLEGCGPSVRETRIQESLATCCARDGLGAPEERVQLPRRTW